MSVTEARKITIEISGETHRLAEEMAGQKASIGDPLAFWAVSLARQICEAEVKEVTVQHAVAFDEPPSEEPPSEEPPSEEFKKRILDIVQGAYDDRGDRGGPLR